VVDWSLNIHCIGTMKSCLACGELAQAFFVFIDEVLPKLNECLLCNRADLPHVTCGGEDASCFKHEEGKVFDGNVGQGVATSDKDVLDFTEAFPQGFNGIIGSPDCCNAGTIALQFSMGDGTIVGA